MAVTGINICRAGRIIILSLGLLGSAAAVSADVVVIANPSLAVDTLTAEQIKEIFTAAAPRLPDGTPCKVIDQAEQRPARTEFYQKVLHKTPEQAKAYWAKQIFTGNGVPPPVVMDDAAVKKWLSRFPDGIGYIDETAVDGSVKVLLRP
ncbi:MAG: hypothetical protein FD165_1228 [Gammaproteobacteria bacterium]|nr:MAG: hypothetical protein FD165_1228 [Gammaproteobacteria bacterium]TND07387.1 MAG: hypothetical protein FD120_125 [Gammaproteobacteria bacterium]